MKKFFTIVFLSVFAFTLGTAQQAKYVFYFIGDGMGVNHVHATEMYRGELAGKIGIVPLCFTEFPHSGLVTTYSASNGVTDSAASGTALSTGSKTNNHMIGMNPDTADVYSVARAAHQKGVPVGIGTTVSANHATPSAFYAHQPHRELYYNISLDMLKAGYPFYAGADIQLESRYREKRDSIYRLFDKAGYAIARGFDEYNAKAEKAKKMILFQKEGVSQYSLPFAIDRSEQDLTLTQITRAAIDFLSRQKGDKGFFMMMEGGRIDQAAHVNDGATVINEVMDFDQAIREAYDFYLQHPDETLIVVTADHETGGMILGYSGDYILNLQLLQYQKISRERFYDVLEQARKENRDITWEEVQAIIRKYFGFWEEVRLSDRESERLQNTFERSFKEHISPLRDEVVNLMNRKAILSWASGNHSGGYVPVFAIGAGSEKFDGRIDNTDIPKKIKEIAGY